MKENERLASQYGFLKRLIDEGNQVVMDDKLLNKLYLSPDKIKSMVTQSDETTDEEEEEKLGEMTQTQRERFEKLKKRKPRPRDIFDVNKMIVQREKKAIAKMESAKF